MSSQKWKLIELNNNSDQEAKRGKSSDGIKTQSQESVFPPPFVGQHLDVEEEAEAKEAVSMDRGVEGQHCRQCQCYSGCWSKSIKEEISIEEN